MIKAVVVADSTFEVDWSPLASTCQAQGLALAWVGNLSLSAQANLTQLQASSTSFDERAFWFIAAIDTVHHTWPHQALMAEILARIGFEPDETLLLTSDAISSSALHYVHVLPMNADNLATYVSRLAMREWLMSFTPPARTPQAVLAQLVGNISAMFGLLSDLSPHLWHQRPMADEWSIVQILSHLVLSERDVERPRLAQILQHNNPFIIAPIPPGPQLKPLASDAYQLAFLWAEERKTTLQQLRDIAETAWLRPARHSVFGHTNLLEMAAFTAQHDRLHINQLCQTIGSCQEA